MLSAGEIGAVFIIKDEASAVLKRLMDQMNALQASIDKTRAALGELKFPPGLNRSIANMDKALLGAGDSAAKLAGTVDTSFGKMDVSVNETTAAVARLKTELASMGRTSREAAVFGGGVGVPSGLRARGAGGGLGGGRTGGGIALPHGGGGHGDVAAIGVGATLWGALTANAALQQVQERMARPVCKEVCRGWRLMQSASTYPASRSFLRP